MLTNQDIFYIVMPGILCSGKYHGVLLIPEGLIESIPEMYALIQV